VDGKKMALKSDFQPPFDVEHAAELIIFDGHSQDNSLQN
jgi:hypothetical protein